MKKNENSSVTIMNCPKKISPIPCAGRFLSCDSRSSETSMLYVWLFTISPRSIIFCPRCTRP